MIRLVNKDDYDKAKELIDALIQESVYKFIFKDYQLTKELFNFYTSNPKQCIAVFVLNENNEEVGIGVYDVIPWLNNDIPIRICRVAYIYLVPSERAKGYGKELKDAFEYWGKSVGATHYSTNKKTDGYQKVETIYMKEVT